MNTGILSRLLLAFSLPNLFCIGRAADSAFTLPPGFSVERVAAPPQIQFPMFACRDERRRLFVAESSGLDLYAELQQLTRKCRISVLEDRNGDGRFEHAQVFADQLVFPMGLAWRDGKLYVADPPDLITLEDTDGDGRADRRTVLLTGFGHRDNGSLHGLTFGPDGWLYLTMGGPDSYKLKRADGTWLEGTSGALLRCRPDGSGVEMVCRGFENLVEVEFLPTGEIIGTDNWFSLPQGGERDALVHLVEGGTYPLHAHEKAEVHLFHSGELLPPIALYPAVALSGLVRYRGNAFPTRLQGALFSAQFNARRIVAHRLQRLSSTFRSADEDFLTTDDPDFHPSDVLEDTDGSLLVIDTGSWYVHHCPTGRIRKVSAQGGIYRVRHGRPREGQILQSAARNPQSAITQNLPASASANSDEAARTARAFGRANDKTAEKALLGLLARPEPHVRLAAAEALAHCGSSNAVPELLAALAGDIDRFLEHALTYTLHEIADSRTLFAALEHPHPRVQKAAMVLLDQAPHHQLALAEVVKRLSASDEALARGARATLRRHPEWVGHAHPLVRDLASRPSLLPAERDTLREFVFAFLPDPEFASLVGEIAAAPQTSDAARRLTLEAMSRGTSGKASPTWTNALAKALAAPSREIQFQAIQTLQTLRLPTLDTDITQLANDNTNPAPLRVEAFRALARRRSGFAPAEFAFLLQQLARTNSAVARLAASEVIGVAALNENQLTRYVRAVTGDTMISPHTVLGVTRRIGLSEDSSAALLDFLQTANSSGLPLTDEQLDWLGKAAPAIHQERVKELRRATGESLDRQRQQLAAVEPLLQGGDAGRGRKVFFEKAGCATCHRVGRQGGQVGPDLTKVGAIRSGRDLIESLVLPSASIAQGYDSYSVTLKSGDELTGIRARQLDDSMVLRDASGAETRLQPEQVQSMERLKLSLMPEGLLAALSQTEIRDLLAYLQDLK